MNIYFSCSITGGRSDQSHYKAIVDHLLAGGHIIPTAHLSNPDVASFESIIEPHEVFIRDMAWVAECDALIAEVSTPSHGVGYEIAQALWLKKPVLCCYQKGKNISKMITGNSSPGFYLFEYADHDSLIVRLDNFLSSCQNH